MRQTEIKNKTAFVFLEPILMNQNVHVLDLQDVIVFIVSVQTAVFIVQEVIMFDFAPDPDQRTQDHSSSLIVLEVIVTDLQIHVSKFNSFQIRISPTAQNLQSEISAEFEMISRYVNDWRTAEISDQNSDIIIKRDIGISNDCLLSDRVIDRGLIDIQGKTHPNIIRNVRPRHISIPPTISDIDPINIIINNMTMSHIHIPRPPINIEPRHMIMLLNPGLMNMDRTPHTLHPNAPTLIAPDHSLSHIEIISLGPARSHFQEHFCMHFSLGLERDEYVVAGGDHWFGSGVVPDGHRGDDSGVGVGTVSDLDGGHVVLAGDQVDEV